MIWEPFWSDRSLKYLAHLSIINQPISHQSCRHVVSDVMNDWTDESRDALNAVSDDTSLLLDVHGSTQRIVTSAGRLFRAATDCFNPLMVTLKPD